MTKSAFWRAGALALVAVLVLPTIVPGLALATEAKHTALNGSLLHSTSAELNAFAHKGAAMSNFVEITTGQYPFDSSNGHGRLLFGVGESMKFQLQANDNGFPARGIDYFSGGTSGSSVVSDWFSDPAQIFDMDVIGGSDDLSWSGGLSLAQSKDEVTTDDTVKDNTTGFGIRASVGSEQFDAGAEFAKTSLTHENPAEDPSKVETNETMFGAYAQMHMEEWQLIGALAVGSTDDDNDATADDPSMVAFLAAAGYHFRNDDDGHVTGQLHVQYVKTSDNFDAGDNEFVDETNFYVPGVEVAVDHRIGERFRVYAAADASWVMTTVDTVNAADVDDTQEDKTSSYAFDWTAGLGFSIFDNVQLDFVLQTDNLDQLLSLGNQEPLIGQISANVTY